MHLASIDIGGTKISVSIGNETGAIYTSKRILTQPLKGWKNGLKAVAELLRELCHEQKIPPESIASIGISCPGPISLEKGEMLRPPNLPGWENAKIVQFFTDEFKKPTRMNHDGKAAALAEYLFGGSKGTSNLIYLTCSTGMGGGAIVDGKLVQGASDTAAEVGHFILDVKGPICPCGLKGCFEAYCGGAAIAKRMREEILKEKIDTQVLKEADGHVGQIDMGCLIAAVQKKDPYAERIWEEFVFRLAQGVGTVLMNFNPEVIILGTIAIHSGPLLLDPLRKLLPHFAWKENIQACRVEASSLGDHISELSGLALAAITVNELKSTGNAPR